jgi:hypothetical protein
LIRTRNLTHSGRNETLSKEAGEDQGFKGTNKCKQTRKSRQAKRDDMEKEDGAQRRNAAQMLGGGHTHIGRGEVMRSWGLYGRSPIGCPGEFGEVTEDDPVWARRNTTLASPSKRGIWGNPGGRPNTVRAT